MVLIEGDHLVEHLLGHLVHRGELEGCDGHLDITQPTDDRLNLCVVDSIHRLDHHKVVVLLGILKNGSLNGSKVLLVGQINMI